MQRYRVNYGLMAALAIGLVVAAPTAYGLWRFQVGRNASRLLEQADAAEASNDQQEVFESLRQYVRLRRDDDAARIRLGNAAVKLSEQEDLDTQLRSEAYFAVIDGVLRTEDHGLRRKLVDLHLNYGYVDRALEAINKLIEVGKEDGELLALKARCLLSTQATGEFELWSYQLIGYDQKTKTFDVKKARAPHQPIVYAMLGQYLLSSNQRDKVAPIVEQMVVANPESSEAFTFQYQLLKSLGDDEAARAALDKAFALEPDNDAVLQGKGAEAIADYSRAMQEANDAGDDKDRLQKEADKHLEAAAKFFERGLEKYPDRIGFFEQAARIEMFRQRLDGALAILDRGIKQFDLATKVGPSDLPLAIDLVSLKVDILFAQKDVDAVRREIKALRDLDNKRVKPMADYFEARIELFNQNWLEAARRMNEVKVRLIGMPNLQALASVSQAACHVQLGQYDLAREAYRYAMDKNPDMPIAKAGYAEMERLLGQSSTEGTPLQFDEVVNQELARPEAEQDWERVEAQIDEYVNRQAEVSGQSDNWIKTRQELLKAQMYVTRASRITDKTAQSTLFQQARAAIKRALELDRNDPTVQLAAPRVLALEPGTGPAKALEMLDGIIAMNQKRGVEETLPFRLLRIELLFALRDDDLPNQLHAATAEIDKWAPAQQAEVWAAVASRFEQLNRLPDATMCLQEAIKLTPSSLPYRVALFELARKQADDPAMREAQAGILELVKDKNAPDYVLTEVKRMMMGVGTGIYSQEDLKQARNLLDAAIRSRSGWAELYVLSGQLRMVMREDPNRALADFDLALKNGPANLNALNLQVRLLFELGRFADARKIMDRIPEQAWTSLLERVAANVLVNVGETDAALREARKVIETNGNDATLQAWFAEVAAKAKDLTAAENAYKRAVELSPTTPEYWSSLLNFYMQQNRGPSIEQTLRQAQLALDAEYLTLLTAEQHRLFGRFNEAERIYLSAYADKVNELPIAQRLAEFYLNWAERDAIVRARSATPPTNPVPGGTPEIRVKAARYLNTILRAAYEGKTPSTDAAVAWARRQAARLFSLNGDYQDSLKAERLLASAVAQGSSTTDGQEMLIDILNRRGDPASRERMITLLQQLQKARPLSPAYELILGQAMFDVRPWAEADRQMQDAIGRHPKDVPLRVGLIEMCITRKDEGSAERWMSRLESIEGGEAALPQLRVRLAAAVGKKDEVRSMLQALTPNLMVLKQEQLPILHAVAVLANTVGDNEYALKLITEYSRRVPGNEMELAHFTAMYGDLDAGLAMLRQLFPQHMDPVLSTAIEVLRTRRSEDPAKVDEAVNLMLRQARRDDPEAARRMVMEAEALEIQQKFTEAVAAYRTLLARDDVPRIVRATALNNLSFLLAMMKQDLDQALAGVNEAMNIIGPISDILDTRALVYLHRGEFNEAVTDAQAAVKVNATASKYFHLAAALLGAGDKEGALAAWKEAQARGIKPESVPEVERPDLEQLQQKLDALRSRTDWKPAAAPVALLVSARRAG